MSRDPRIGRRPLIGQTATPPVEDVVAQNTTAVQQQQLQQEEIPTFRSIRLQDTASIAPSVSDPIDYPINGTHLEADSVTAAKIAALTITVGKYIKSSNYVVGVAGWAIDGNGNAEFNNVTVRGVFETDTSPSPRVQLTDSGGSPEVRFYTGNGSEIVPGRIVGFDDDINNTSWLQVLSPQFYASGGGKPYISLVGPDASGNIAGVPLPGGQILLTTDEVHVGGLLSVHAEIQPESMWVYGTAFSNSIRGQNGGAANLRCRNDANNVTFDWVSGTIKIYIDGTLVKTI